MIDKPFPNVALAVLVLRARPTSHRPGVEHHRRPAAVVETGECVLEPSPIALTTGDPTLRSEPIERIITKKIRIERLIPHRISNDDVVGSNTLPVGRLELWIDHRVTPRDLDGHVVDDRVHLRDRVALGRELLAVQ